MREITITFTLYDEHEERLKKIVEEYKRQHNFEQTEDKIFEMIMLTGSKHDIDAKLKFHEWKLELREDFKEKGCVADVSQPNRTDNRRKNYTKDLRISRSGIFCTHRYEWKMFHQRRWKEKVP